MLGRGMFGCFGGIMKRVRFVFTGTSVLAMCAASFLAAPAAAADLGGPYESYKDEPAIAGGANWAGFYAGGHIGGRWGDSGQSFTVEGGNGGGGGGGGGDNNWVKKNTPPALVDGGPGQNGNAGGAGGRGGNSTADLTGISHPERRIGGQGGDGGAGGRVTGDGGDDDGFVGGIHMGYNWQRGDLVFGVEGDVSFDGALDNYLASLRGRIGLARNDTFFYITGGLAIRNGGDSDAVGLATNGGAGGHGGQNDDGIDDGTAEIGHPAIYGGLGGNGGSGGTPTTSGFGGKTGNDTGFVAGGGVEYMLSSNVSAGLEGLHYFFDDDRDITVLRARLTYHLNGGVHESFKDSYLSASITNWSGFYAGVNTGFGFGNGKRVDSVKTANGGDGTGGTKGAEGNINKPSVCCSLPVSDGIDDPGGAGGGGGGGSAALISLKDDGGALGGVHLGYNWQSGARVFGVEGDANLADQNFRDYLASVRVRLGHSFDQVLVYGTAGVAFGRSSDGITSVSVSSGNNGLDGGNGKFENDPSYIDPVHGDKGGTGGEGGEGGLASVTRGGSDDKVGFVVGGGFEVKLNDRTSLGVEGLYYGFDGDGSSSTSTSYTSSDDMSTAVVRGRLTYHLDGGDDEQAPLK